MAEEEGYNVIVTTDQSNTVPAESRSPEVGDCRAAIHRMAQSGARGWRRRSWRGRIAICLLSVLLAEIAERTEGDG